MAKRSPSSPRGARVGANSQRTAGRRRIDYSDIAESSPAQLRAMKRVGRPPIGDEPRQLIAIRVDTAVLGALRKEARRRRVGYQTLINEVLARLAREGRRVTVGGRPEEADLKVCATYESGRPRVRCEIDGWPGDAGPGRPTQRAADTRDRCFPTRDKRTSASTGWGMSGGRTRPSANFAMHSEGLRYGRCGQT
jgi:uncharacterized protein (DUF4415 family)